ncbi:S8 family serine peptidase, partial [archaeon AH-315-M20]|nr:S8 family serine peptidase [archaeon AH-315-M20]
MKKIILIAFIVAILLISITTISAASGKEKRVIILYKDDVTDLDIDDLKKKKAKIKHKHKIIPAVTIYVDEKDIDKIKLNKKVKAVYEDMRVHAFLADSVPQINADQVHAVSVTGSGVKVCIVDTGIDYTHPGLGGCFGVGCKVIDGFDFVNSDNDPIDDNGHGTHVAGIVASSDSTYKGVAYGSSLMAAKVLDALGGGFASDVISGIEWCVTNGADIISMSLGGGAFTSSCDSDPLAQASNNAVDTGVVVLAASGNDGYINAISTPACASEVIAVGAVNDFDGRTSFSNEGTELDIVAPGVGIVSTILGDSFGSKTGTSMATPHASGTAALVLETDPTLTPTQVRNILRNTALDLGASGFDTIYGYGRIDAFAAYQSAVGQPPQPSCSLTSAALYTKPAHTFNSDVTNVVSVQDGIFKKVDRRKKVLHVEFDSNLGTGDIISAFVKCDNTGTIEVKEEGLGTVIGTATCQKRVWQTVEITLTAGLSNTFDLNSDSFNVNYDSVGCTVAQVGNQIPISNAGPDQTVSDGDGTGNETVTLDGSSSSDPDGTIVSYEWKEGTTSLGTTAVVTTSLTVGVHTIELTITDNEGATNSDTVIVTVNANQAPTANAGPDQTVIDSDDNGFETITLDGSASSDSDGIIVSYEWSEGVTILGSSSIINVSFAVGVHNVSLKVTDNAGATNTDNMVVNVNLFVNQNPVANAGSDKNALVDDTVNFDGSGSFDPDGSIVSYAWDFGDNSTSSGVTTSHVYGVAGTYTATLTVTDDNGGFSASDDVLIVVKEATETDTVTITKAQYRLKNEQLRVQATTTDPNAILTLVGYGEMTKKGDKYVFRLKGAANPGPTITVESSSGGSNTKD